MPHNNVAAALTMRIPSRNPRLWEYSLKIPFTSRNQHSMDNDSRAKSAFHFKQNRAELPLFSTRIFFGAFGEGQDGLAVRDGALEQLDFVSAGCEWKGDLAAAGRGAIEAGHDFEP